MPAPSATCPRCGAINVGNLANCLRCQAPLQPTPTPAAPPPTPVAGAPAPPPAPAAHVPDQPSVGTRRCNFCGAQVPAQYRFCTACGRPMDVAAAAAPPTWQSPTPPVVPAAAPPAWQQPAAYQPAPPGWPPPAAGYPYPQPVFANNSGTGGPPPREILGWNWGAFFWGWLWGLAHGVWISLLVFLLGGIWHIYLGIKGSELAWRSRRFESVEQFKATQRAWAIWGWVFFVGGLVLVVVATLVIVAAVAAGTLDWDALRQGL